jgi:hypothetical protein
VASAGHPGGKDATAAPHVEDQRGITDVRLEPLVQRVRDGGGSG